MAKKKEVQEVEEIEVNGNTLESLPDRSPAVEFNDEAFSISKDKTTGKYHLVTIKYDFDTRTLGTLEVSTETNDEKLIMFDNMKIAIGKYMWR